MRPSNSTLSTTQRIRARWFAAWMLLQAIGLALAVTHGPVETPAADSFEGRSQSEQGEQSQERHHAAPALRRGGRRGQEVRLEGAERAAVGVERAPTAAPLYGPGAALSLNDTGLRAEACGDPDPLGGPPETAGLRDQSRSWRSLCSGATPRP